MKLQTAPQLSQLDDYQPRIERQIRRIERELIESLTAASRTREPEPEEPASQTDSLSQTNPLRAEYAKHLIREKVLQVQKLGAEYACNFFNLNHFYAAEDFSEVGRITDDVYRSYAYGGRIETAVVTLTSVMLARATIQKARQIYSKYIQIDSFMGAIMRMKSIQKFVEVPEIDNPDEEPPTIEDLTPEPPQVGLFFVWRTMGDDKVCDICEPLDNMEWDFDDPNVDSEMLTPVDDTHPNCRCRVDLERRTISE